MIATQEQKALDLHVNWLDDFQFRLFLIWELKEYESLSDLAIIKWRT